MPEAESKRIFQKRFRELLEERRLSQKEIAEICNVSTSTVSTWFKGINIPRMDKIERLANYFGLPKSYFIEENPVSAVSPDDIKAAFFNGVDPTLTQEEIDAMWEDARAFLQFKLEQRKKQKNNE